MTDTRGAGAPSGEWFPAIRSDDLPAATPDNPGIRRVTIGTTDVLLARLAGGEVVAFGTVCPHQLTDLRDAHFWDGNLRCPRHQYLYDPRSGENILPTREAPPENLWKLRPGYLPTYRVEEREGWVWVDEAPKPPPAAYDRTLEQRPPSRTSAASAAAAAEAGPAPAAQAGAAGTVEHPPKTLKVRSGATFELRLPTVPRPGFTWNVQVKGSLKVEAEGYVPGDQPRHRVRFRARLPGDALIRCIYARPWDTTPAEVRTYRVHVLGQDTPRD